MLCSQFLLLRINKLIQGVWKVWISYLFAIGFFVLLLYQSFSFIKKSTFYESIFEKRFSAKPHSVFRFCRHKTGKKSHSFCTFCTATKWKNFLRVIKRIKIHVTITKDFLAGCIYVRSHVNYINDFEWITCNGLWRKLHWD